MDNPYTPSITVSDFPPRDFAAQVRKLRTIVAFLVCVVVFQWGCHLLTAIAMVSWMKKTDIGPTAQAIDTAFLGFACVGVTALMSFVAGAAGSTALRRSSRFCDSKSIREAGAKSTGQL